MERAIYYPGFEVQDEDWLKFALLYVDKLHPIIPPRSDHKHSAVFEKLRGETDLIIPHPPTYEAGFAASLDAIGQVQKILEKPDYFSAVFPNQNIVAKWKNPYGWGYKIYGEKYSDDWARFCRHESLGKQINGGMLLERSLGLLYMSILADIISENQELPSLTDSTEMNRISILTRRAEPLAPMKIFVAQSIIKMQLPIGVNQISLDQVIEQRNKPGFKSKMHAFHSELTAHIEDVENGEAEGDFLQTRGSAFEELSDELLLLGLGLVEFGLGVASAIQKPEENIEAMKALAEGGALAGGSVIALRSAWQHSKDARFTRKYLADLKQLGA